MLIPTVGLIPMVLRREYSGAVRYLATNVKMEKKKKTKAEPIYF